jgi:hypothetical protein
VSRSDPHQTVPLHIVSRPKTTPVHELERYMRCKDCSQVRGYAYKRSHLGVLRTTRFPRVIRRQRGGRGSDEASRSTLHRTTIINRISL